MANNDAFAGIQAVSALPKAGQLLGTGIAKCERIGTGFVEGANAKWYMTVKLHCFSVFSCATQINESVPMRP